MEWAEPIAYGPLALKPWDFFRLTVDEFHYQYQGYVWRRRRREEELAIMTVPLLNVAGKSLKKPLSMDEFLGKKISAEQRKEEARKLLEEFGPPPAGKDGE